MRRRLGAVPSVLLLACAGVLAIPAASIAEAGAHHRVRITHAPTSVNEGRRLAIGTRVTAASTARRVQLQEKQTDVYGTTTWVTVRSVRVAGSRHTFHVIATQQDRETYRARAAYDDGTAVASHPVHVTVWRWIPLTDYYPYYATSGATTSAYSSFAINGTEYHGWSTFGDYPSWESRYTLGRHCKAIRAVTGLQDGSDDGSSATTTLVADGTTVYQSPSLTPGMQAHVKVSLGAPYRLSVQGHDTSPNGVVANPAFGDPELLCTHVNG